MKIAILGATSYIAKDLIISFSENSNYELKLFARMPNVVSEWLKHSGIKQQYSVCSYEEFGLDIELDAIINFVGVGDPAKAKEMGASILDITYQYDNLAISYVKKHTKCKYIFLSSGAAYNCDFDKPIENNTCATIPLNNLQPQNWYGIAKLYAECRHRSFYDLPIVDIRVFNYFSSRIDISSSFLMSNIVNAILTQEMLRVSCDDIVRDYIGPGDFYQLIELILGAGSINDAVDCYTKKSVGKMEMLKEISKQFSLGYSVDSDIAGVDSTGMKNIYCSNNRRAFRYGYEPTMTSIETVLFELKKTIPNQ